MAPELQSPSPEALAALLDWYVANDVDVAIEEEAVNRLVARVAEEPAPTHRAMPASFDAEPRPQPQPTIATALSPEAEVLAAREAAAGAATLDALKDALARFEGCALKTTAKSLVFSQGNPTARVMLVGDPPGRDEDLQGEPFVGQTGPLVDRMLAAIGLSRAEVYLANIVPWRPPGNRTPTPQETATCRPFLDRQIELVDPDYLVCLGPMAAKELLPTTEGLLRMRGQWFPYDTGKRQIQAMATLHPSYLLLQPLQKRLVWRDLLVLRTAMDAKTA
ncbi:MAG: uracil-DNA glycosylase [Candidatus Kaistia colombiensis]|nr:MAG: uracil-DNA glycosylase [Kaistia sp.]